MDWPYRSSPVEIETGQGPVKESASVVMIRKYCPTYHSESVLLSQIWDSWGVVADSSQFFARSGRLPIRCCPFRIVSKRVILRAVLCHLSSTVIRLISVSDACQSTNSTTCSGEQEFNSSRRKTRSRGWVNCSTLSSGMPDGAPAARAIVLNWRDSYPTRSSCDRRVHSGVSPS